MVDINDITLQKLMDKLGVTRYPQRWENIFQQAAETYRTDGNPLLHPEYYDVLHDSYGVLPDFLDIYKNAAAAVAEIPELALFFTLLCRAMEDRQHILDDIRDLDLPQPPAGQPTLPYDMLTALVMLQSVPQNYAELVRRGVPEASRDFALRAPEHCVTGGVLAGRPRLEHFDYYQRAYDCRLHRFGRLEYEFPRYVQGCCVLADGQGNTVILAHDLQFHRSGQVLGTAGFADAQNSFWATVEQTDEYMIGHAYDANGCANNQPIKLEKAKWQPVLQPGDPVVGIHIPGGYVHGPLTPEAVGASLEQARKALNECYPEYGWKAFHCCSWLIDPAIAALLGEQANLAKFNRRFLAYGTKPSDGKSVYDYVFGADRKLPVEALPDTTSLQKKIKQWYLDGGIIRNMDGIILK